MFTPRLTRPLLGLHLLAALALLAACTMPPTGTPGAAGASLHSDVPRDTAPDVPDADLAELVAGQTDFNFALYHALADDSDTNLFYSPYSIALALAMTYAGAGGETATQMAEALRFTLPDAQLHAAFNALDQLLASRGEGAQGQDEGTPFRLNIANALWGQNGYDFLPAFLDTLAQNYGAGLQLVDFQADAEAARQTINRWVSDQTEERIPELLGMGAVDALTRLVLTNAIYFNAAWAHPFEDDNTEDGPFTLLDGSEVTAPLMHLTAYFPYTDGDGWQALRLPYQGDELAMTILLPTREGFADFEAGLDAATWAAISGALRAQEVRVTLPRFEFSSDFSLAGTLAALGMGGAFGAQADFSGMTGDDDLFIGDVVHKAFVSVNEEGTEAAAATAVMMATGAAPGDEPPSFTADHPFIFVISDVPTGAVLFTGRVLAVGE